MTTQSSIATRANMTIVAAVTVTALAEIFVAPRLLAGHPLALTALIILLLPVGVPFWSLIHEAVHKNLHPGREANEFGGRALSVLFGIPFALLRFGHLMHHQYNREWETELYDPVKPKLPYALNHYAKMLGGLYISEVIAAFAIAVSPAPLAKFLMRKVFADDRHHEAALRVLLKPENVWRVRVDCVCIVLLYGAAMAVAGWAPVLGVILGRALVVSILDNAYHYGTAPDNSEPALELAVPRGIARFMLNFNHHRTHHANPALPWPALPARHADSGIGYAVGLPEAVMAQFKGPIAFARGPVKEPADAASR